MMPPQTQSKEGKAVLAPERESSEEPTFKLFPELPVEIRIKIWGNACSVTRNVDIWIKMHPISGFFCPEDNPCYWYSSCAVPAVLHVNKESRAEALKHYTADFGTNHKFQNEDPIPFIMSLFIPGRIYINWFNDRLCLLDLYRMGEWELWDPESMRSQEFADRCTKQGLRYFAINTARDAGFIVTEEVIEKNEDLGFMWYMPRKAMFEELLLFETHDWANQSDNSTVPGLNFVDVREGVDRRLDFVKTELTSHIQDSRDITTFQVMLVIRTCTATLLDSAEST